MQVMRMLNHWAKRIWVSSVTVLAVVSLFVVYALSFVLNLFFLAVGAIGVLFLIVSYGASLFLGEVVPDFVEKTRKRLEKWVANQMKDENE